MKLPPIDSQYELPPEGNHLAICIRFIDLGTQLAKYGTHQRQQRKILLFWELPFVRSQSDDKPLIVCSRYTWSMDVRSNLRRDLEYWRGHKFDESDCGPEGFDIRKFLGTSCLLMIVHEQGTNGNTYGNIKAVTKVPNGLQIPAQFHDKIYFAMDLDGDISSFASLSDTIRAEIEKSPQWQAMQTQAA